MEEQSNLPSNMNNQLDAIDFNSDGGLFLSASSLTNRTWSGSVWYFDKPEVAPDIERCSAGVESEGGVSDLAWLRGSERVICGTDNGLVMLWELTDNRGAFVCSSTLIGHHSIVSSVSQTSDRSKVLSGSHDLLLKVWDLEELECVASYRGHFDIVHCVEGHPTNTNVFVSAAQDNRLVLWDIRETKPASLIETKFLPSPPVCVTWQPGKDHIIAVGTETGSIVVQDTRWSVGTPTVTQPHNRPITRLKFAPHKPDWLASSGEDSMVKVTDISSGNVIYQDAGHTDMVRGLAWEPSSQHLYSCGWDRTIIHREVSESEQLSLDAIDITEKSSPKDTDHQMDTQTTHSKCNGSAT